MEDARSRILTFLSSRIPDILKELLHGPMPHMAYVASKGALHQLTVSLSNYFIERGITVNTVNPGPTKTYTPSDELNEAVLKRMPQGRWGEPDDAARLIAWLVSDDASWVAGQVINSEGGFRRG